MRELLDSAKRGLAIMMGFTLLAGAVSADPHARMMRAVFKIEGKKKEGAGNEAAAAFALALPRSSDTPDETRVVLVTAAHFFDKIEGDRIELVGRRLRNDGGYEKTRHPIALESGGKRTWTRHADSQIDVAVVELDWPEDCDVLPVRLDRLATTASIATETTLRPGRAVFSPGYPFAIESSDAGFPILRSGHIASYPPPRGPDQKTFLVDMAIFAGFSGSPVYAIDEGATSEPLVLGMIYRQHELTSDFKGPFETRKVHYMLDLAIAVKAPIIRELVTAREEP